jgi:hypothetical protein
MVRIWCRMRGEQRLLELYTVRRDNLLNSIQAGAGKPAENYSGLGVVGNEQGDGLGNDLAVNRRRAIRCVE